MRLVLISAVMGLLLLVGAANTRAGMYFTAMYCGNDLITDGMTKLDVSLKCGEPDLMEPASVNTLGIIQRKSFRESTSALEVWYYNCGQYRFNKSLYFDGGKLVTIKDSSAYGSGPERCS
jgi:Protein of unknown function (DUF2845)